MNTTQNQRPLFLSLAFFGTILSIFLVVAISTTPQADPFTAFDQPDSSSAATSVTITIDPNQSVGQFKKTMRGVGFVNWEHSWAKPFLGDVPGLSQAIKEINPGIFRYAGGLWANSVGFDRVPQRTPYTQWQKNGLTYSFHYGLNEIDSINTFAKAVGSDVMIQVNVSNNDPAMWADMVKYTNQEKQYGFKYWELGNELDFDKDHPIDAATYANRFAAYYKAMVAVDPNVKLRGPAVAYPVEQNDATNAISSHLKNLPTQIKTNGGQIDAVSWHWYQGCNITALEDVTRFSWGSGTPDNSWRNAYSRRWATLMPARLDREVLTPAGGLDQGVTELNVDACNFDNPRNGNHIGAIWFGDVLGRLAASGADYTTMYEGYGTQSYSLLYPNNADRPTRIDARPTYYTYLMYSHFFGDQMIKATSSDEASVSVWASTKASTPGKIYLMVTNFSNTATSGQFNLPSNITTAQAYTLKSNNPTDTSAASMTTAASTNINGGKIDAMNVAASLAQIQPTNLTVNNGQLSTELPAYSLTAIVLTQSGSPVTPTTTRAPSPTTVPTTTPGTPTSTPTGKQGDINQDGTVSVFDLGILAAHYGEAITAASSEVGKRCDLNADNKVDVFDLGFLMGKYGK